MKRYALIQAGRVATVTEQVDPPTVPGQWVDCTGHRVGPGFAWDGAQFSDPPAPSFPTMTVLAFRQRLTIPERVAIEQASIGTSEAASTVRVWLGDLAATREVTLTHPATIAGVQHMEAAGLIAVGRAAEILNAPITAAEAA